MKKMNNIFIVSLALFMGLSLTACSSKQEKQSNLDPKVVYENVQKKSQEMESFTAEMTMNMNMDIDVEGEKTQFEVPITANIEATSVNSQELMFHMTMHTEMFEEAIDSEQWYFDGTMYSNVSDMKVYQKIEFDDAKEQIQTTHLFGLTFEKMSVSETNGKTILTIQPTQKELLALMDKLNMDEAGIDDEILNDPSTKFEFSDYVLTINEDGFVEDEKIAITIETQGISIHMSVNMTISKINETTVEKIDVSDYISAEELDLDLE